MDLFFILQHMIHVVDISQIELLYCFLFFYFLFFWIIVLFFFFLFFSDEKLNTFFWFQPSRELAEQVMSCFYCLEKYVMIIVTK